MKLSLVFALAIALAACKDKPAPTDAAVAPADGAATLAFVRDGKPVKSVSRDALAAAVPPETWTAFDPYYGRPKTYRALPLGRLLAFAFGAPEADLAKLDFVLRARDGYTMPLPGAKLFETGGYLAIADVDVPDWEPIGPGRANPAPFYLVWRGDDQHSLDTHPRPWQLASIEIAPFDVAFPHTVPTGFGSTSAEMKGFRLFRAACISCHAVNREGGRIGPDLNVPQSIVEYRPAPQILAYIADPRQFRYSNMPPHPDFSADDLQGLLSYFRAMKDRKFDPDASKPAAH